MDDFKLWLSAQSVCRDSNCRFCPPWRPRHRKSLWERKVSARRSWTKVGRPASSCERLRSCNNSSFHLFKLKQWPLGVLSVILFRHSEHLEMKSSSSISADCWWEGFDVLIITTGLTNVRTGVCSNHVCRSVYLLEAPAGWLWPTGFMSSVVSFSELRLGPDKALKTWTQLFKIVTF